MKRILSIILISALLICALTVLPVSAYDVPLTVPKVYITTEAGNGTSLQKEDGYVNATVSITDTGGYSLSDTVGFKVRGNSTALSFVQKKAFTFKFDKKKDVLGMGKAKKWALLANAFDPTLMRNYIAFDLAHKMGLPYTSQQRIVELWVDDSYRGCYTLMEPIQKGDTRVDIDTASNGGLNDFMIELESSRAETDVTYFTVYGMRFAVSEPETPAQEQQDYISSTLRDIITLTRTGTREEIEQKIDIASFARYYLLNELLKTVDFNFSSVFYFYKNGKLYAGPAWDYDLSSGNSNADYSANAKAAASPTGVYAADKNIMKYLCDLDWFNDEVISVFRQYYADIRDITATDGVMDSLLSTYGDVFSRNYTGAGWSPSKWAINVMKKPLSTYDDNVAYMRDWLDQRIKYLTDYFKQYLSGDADADGDITILDATRIQRYLAGFKTDIDLDAADSNSDGIDILDATVIQRYLAGLSCKYDIGVLTARPI